MTVVCVWVSADAGRNLEIGLDQQLWGWKDKAVSEGRAEGVAQRLKLGDWLMLGQRGPGNPRVPAGRWAGSRIENLYLARISRGYFRSEDPVWPDAVYPHRVELDQPQHHTGIGAAVIGADALEAFRYSGTKYGGPIPVSDAVLDGLGVPIAQQTATEQLERLAEDSPLERLALTAVRAEQQQLRQRKFGNRSLGRCDVCSVELPVPLLRLAHIKRRALCSDHERREMSNVMSACTFGCDELFERGLLVVDDAGQWSCPVLADLPEGELRRQVSFRAGRPCAIWQPWTRPYFDAHREFHAVRAAAKRTAWTD